MVYNIRPSAAYTSLAGCVAGQVPVLCGIGSLSAIETRCHQATTRLTEARGRPSLMWVMQIIQEPVDFCASAIRVPTGS